MYSHPLLHIASVGTPGRIFGQEHLDLSESGDGGCGQRFTDAGDSHHCVRTTRHSVLQICIANPWETTDTPSGHFLSYCNKTGLEVSKGLVHLDEDLWPSHKCVILSMHGFCKSYSNADYPRAFMGPSISVHWETSYLHTKHDCHPLRLR